MLFGDVNDDWVKRRRPPGKGCKAEAAFELVSSIGAMRGVVIACSSEGTGKAKIFTRAWSPAVR